MKIILLNFMKITAYFIFILFFMIELGNRTLKNLIGTEA